MFKSYKVLKVSVIKRADTHYSGTPLFRTLMRHDQVSRLIGVSSFQGWICFKHTFVHFKLLSLIQGCPNFGVLYFKGSPDINVQVLFCSLKLKIVFPLIAPSMLTNVCITYYNITSVHYRGGTSISLALMTIIRLSELSMLKSGSATFTGDMR